MLDESDLTASVKIEVNGVIGELIKQVERQKLEASLESSSSSAIESFDPKFCSSFNSSKTYSPNERSRRHRSGSRKGKVRSRKRKWKPFSKMTWEERKRLEERDSRRAYRSREKMTASGLTLAPYNTTQFLMEDHNVREEDYLNREPDYHNREPDYESIQNNKEDCHSYDSEEDFYFSPDDEEEFLNQQFTETYKSAFDDLINNMSKFELVEELMRLEDEIEGVEIFLKECREKKKMFSESACLDVNAEMEKIQIFQDEIKKLKEENLLLEEKNEMLQNSSERLEAN